VLVMLAQTSVGLVETYFVGMLGTDALGAGRRADADALALHALIIGLVFGLVFTIALILGGEPLYAAMGGSGGSLAAAKIYSHVIFSGAVLVWLFNSLANVIRGTGNMAFPALVTGAGVVVLIPLSPCLIFGLGAFPRLGVAGGAVAALLLRDRQRRLCRLSAFRPLRRSLEAVRRSFALAATRGHSARRRGCRADHRADQSHGCHCDRPCRRLGSRRDRRLRCRRAA
jgi:hypothetical protein